MLLKTVIDGGAGSLEATLTIFKRGDGSVFWTRKFPLRDPANLESDLIRIAWDALRPLFETRINRHIYEVRNALAKPDNPCLRAPFAVPFLPPMVRMSLRQETRDAVSFDTRIGFSVGGRAVYAGSAVPVHKDVPLALRAPKVVQLPQDTCVLLGNDGNAPIYENACVLRAADLNSVQFHYQCTSSA